MHGDTIFAGFDLVSLSAALALSHRVPDCKVIIISNAEPTEPKKLFDSPHILRRHHEDPTDFLLSFDMDQLVHEDEELRRNVRPRAILPSQSEAEQKRHDESHKVKQDDATVNLEQWCWTLFQRCQNRSNIFILSGSPVEKLLVTGKRAQGVCLKDGTKLLASLVVLTPGIDSSLFGNLAHMLPEQADLPWSTDTLKQRTRIDFLPGIANAFVAFPSHNQSVFAPVLGGKVVDCIKGTLDGALQQEWRFKDGETTSEYEKPIAVIGAGVFGLTTALHLAKRGYRNVTIFDSEPYDIKGYEKSGAASSDANKIIRAAYGSQKLYEKLAFEALDVWESWNDAISTSPSLPAGISSTDRVWENCGFLRTCDSDGLDAQEMKTQESFAEHLKGTQFRITSEDRKRDAVIQGITTAKFDPFNRMSRGLRTDGILDATGGFVAASKSCAWVLHLCRQMGVKTKLGPEYAFREYLRDGKAVTGIRTRNGSSHSAAMVIVAAGGWTASIVPETADLLETTGGSIVTIELPKNQPDIWEKYSPVNFPTWSWRADNWIPKGTEVGGIYGFPRTSDGLVKIGFRGAKWTNFTCSNAQGRLVSYPMPHAPGIPRPGMAAIERFCAENMPDLVGLPLSARLCWYTDSIDNSFLIDRVPGCPGLMVASGGSGHGFKFLPVLGEHVVDAMEGKDTPYTRLFSWRQVPNGKRNGLEEGPSSWRTLDKQELVSTW